MSEEKRKFMVARLHQIDTRLDKIDGHIGRLVWLIIAAILALSCRSFFMAARSTSERRAREIKADGIGKRGDAHADGYGFGAEILPVRFGDRAQEGAVIEGYASLFGACDQGGDVVRGRLWARASMRSSPRGGA